MRGVAEFLRSAFEGRARAPTPEELPTPARAWPVSAWVSSEIRRPRERPRIISNIRDNPAASVGDLRRPAALGTMLEGAMAYALDDAIDNRCESLEVRLLANDSAMITHEGPGYAPARAAAGLQRWPWLRRSPEGQIILTQNLAAPVVTCALSHWCRLEVRLAQETWRQAFYRGEPECPLGCERVASARTFTRVHFRPDPQVFGAARFDVDDLYMRALGLMMELCGVELRIVDERYDVELTLTGTGPRFHLAPS